MLHSSANTTEKQEYSKIKTILPVATDKTGLPAALIQAYLNTTAFEVLSEIDICISVVIYV
jgi:predicted solute-binding protein